MNKHHPRVIWRVAAVAVGGGVDTNKRGQENYFEGKIMIGGSPAGKVRIRTDNE